MEFLCLLLITTFPLCLGLSTSRSSDGLYVLKNNSSKELTCISEDDDAAIIWNYNLTSTEDSASFKNFKPVKPRPEKLTNCAIWMSNQCSVQWKIENTYTMVNSILNPMSPVSDYRWEGFKEYDLNQLTEEDEYENLLDLSNSLNDTLAFSVRATRDIKIRLCGNDNAGSSSCLLSKIWVEGNHSVIETCISNTSSDSQQTKNQSCEDVRNVTHESAVFDADEWRTFRLQWISNEKLIKLFDNTAEEAFFEDSVQDWHSVVNISVKSDAAASLKCHNYNYFLVTRSGKLLQTMRFNHSDKNFCVDMLVSLCPDCQLNVSLVNGKNDSALAYMIILGDEYFHSNGLRTWQSIKLNMTSKSAWPNPVTLRITSLLENEDRENTWWAVDSLKFCRKTARTRESTIKLDVSIMSSDAIPKIKCQKLLHGNIFAADLTTPKPFDNVTQLRKHIEKGITPCSPEYQNFNGMSCTSADCICYQGFGKIDGKACFSIVPGDRNITLVEGSKSKPCSMTNSTLELFELPGYKRLKNQNCSMLPCTYVSLKSYTEYNVRVKLANGSTFFNNNIRTLESGMIAEVNFKSRFAYNITAEWKPSTEINGRIRNYTVTLQRIALIGCEDYNITSPAEIERRNTVNDTMASFTYLNPYARYNFTVVANGVEPRSPLTTSVETLPLDIPTMKVSNLRLLYGKSQLAWDGPEDCTLTTGPTNNVKLTFSGISDWVKNYTFTDVVTRNGYYHLKKDKLLPYTHYKVSACIMGMNHSSVNCTNSQELCWVTASAAPPAVENFTIYKADCSSNTISLGWKPPYPSNGIIEFYQVALMNENMSIKNLSIKNSELQKCAGCFVCFESFLLPSNTPTNGSLQLQIVARNKNVTAAGNMTTQIFQLDNLRDGIPSAPENIAVVQQNYGIVTLKWMHPSFSPRKIVGFRIHVVFSQTHLLMQPPVKNHTIDYPIMSKEKLYSKELHLLTSTDYYVHIMAVDCHNRSSQEVKELIQVWKNPTFLSKSELLVEHDGPVIKLTIPAVVNCTRNTTVVVIVKGISECAIKSTDKTLHSPNGTHITTKWIAARYLVNSSESVEFIFNLRQHYGIGEHCFFKSSETYEFEVKVKDTMTNDSLTSTPFNFSHTDSHSKFSRLWLFCIPISLICSLLVFFLYRKYKMRMEPTDTYELSLMHTMSRSKDWVAPCTIQQSIPRVTTRKARVSALGKVQPHFYPVSITEFEEYVNEALASRILEAQYQMLPKGVSKSCEYGYLPENRFKNQSVHIIPYDENRIILKRIPNDPHSDYINASYIQGRRKAKAYIATQGPKRDTETNTNTVPDFWRMIWQENVRVICMLTNGIEDEKRKCEKYWPDIGKGMQIGDTTILNTDHQVFTDYTIRTFQMMCSEGKREIKHFHYMDWPEHGIPAYTQSFVTFLKKLLMTPPGRGPIVVHSCVGIGRTGTFIVCDISLRQAIKERMINIPMVTQKIRRNRTNMVDNAQQYVFAHLVMVECLILQRTRIPCTDQLREKIKELRKQLPSDIQRLKRMVWQDKELHSLATRPPIVDDVIPNRHWEPTEDDPSLAELSPAPVPDSWDGCFRVVSVEGVQRKEQYLATRSPSPSTLPDLWRLVTEKKIELIVVLQRPNAESTISCDIIHDERGSFHFFDTQVEAKSTLEDGEYFTQEKFLLTDTSQDEISAQPVTILTCKGWTYEENGRPPPVAQLVSIWMASEKVHRKESPTLVVCRDGITGCGLYLAMSFLLDRMSIERQCDVIFAVRTIQRSESKFMQSLKQFEYLYDAAINYYSHFETYANFS